ALHEGHVVSAQELTVLLQSVFTQNSRNLILFLQDTLSIDDFTYLSESYGNKNPFQNQQLKHRCVINIVLTLNPKHSTVPATRKKINSIPVETRTLSNKMIRIVPSDSRKKASSTEEKHELSSVIHPVKFISRVWVLKTRVRIQRQSSMRKFTLIFSVLYVLVIPRRTDVVGELRRQLMATEEEGSLSYPPLNVTTGNDICILFYASNFSLKANSSVFIDLTNATFVTQNVDISSSECSDINTTLSLKYTKPVNGISSLEIRFLMTNKFYGGSARNWSSLDAVEIVQDGEKFAKFNVSAISAPAEYSFHCQLVGTSNLYPARLIPSNNEAKNWDVFISRLQIQGFNVKNNQFSYASDCTGFFTPGIWMGLVTSIVLLWILAYGIHVIMQLTTNSRFDDPKGPALSVPQTE
ncbi:V-type proton ATPase subunit S1, partial [Spheniscus demersus]